MASINFLYRSTRTKAPLTLRLLYRHNSKDYVIATKTKLFVEKNYWEKKHFSKSKDAEVKNKQLELNTELQKLDDYIINVFTHTNIKDISKEWLKKQVELFYNPSQDEKQNESVIYWVNRIIADANVRTNSKGGIGIGQSRITSYNRLATIFEEWQGGNVININELNKSKFESFKRWLLSDKKYASTYALKKISDLKTVCKEARANGVDASNELNDIRVNQGSAYDDDMDVITLTEDEIIKIEGATILNESLINARKWLILMCYTGQRGQALSKRLNKDSFVKHGNDLVIKIIQKKGNKPTTIPVLPKVMEIYLGGLPYPVSTQKLNQHFKEIGKIAEINTPTLGRIAELKKVNGEITPRGIKKVRPKYEYISTHIGRRTFASLHYGNIPTPIIMRVTNHSKEGTFLRYINQSDDNHIETFLEFYKSKNIDKSDQKLRILKAKSS